MEETLRVQSSTLRGKLLVPPSKSQTHRALILGAMAKGTSIIDNLLISPDSLCLIASLRALGAHIKLDENQAVIEGIGGNLDGANDVIDVGNSGIALRFLTCLSALSPKPIVITGDDSIRNLRSMQETIDALSLLKVKVISKKENGRPPLIVQGPVQGKNTIVEGMDSQHVSALLILGMFLESLRIEVNNAGEHPWIEMTLSWLNRFGTKYQRDGYHFYEVQGKKEYPGFRYTVPGDFSTALFPIAAAIITQSDLCIQGLDFEDPQGDKQAISLFQKMGAKIEITKEKVSIHSGSQLTGITIDINDCIDALPIVAALACYAKGKTTITNAQSAKGKECNRLICIAQELHNMGGKVTVLDDGLIIHESSLKGSSVDSHQDHRIAMSLAVAGLGAKGPTLISQAKCIAKTYPRFVSEFQSLGANIA